MSDTRPHSGKGQTDREIANATARQCWAAHELLTRAGIAADLIRLQAGVRADDLNDESAQVYVAVVVRAPLREDFSIECGLAGQDFQAAWRGWVVGVAEGVLDESRLRRHFTESTAYQARREILARLRAHGFTVSDDIAIAF